MLCCRSLLWDLDVTSSSRYSRTREALRPDPRYKAMPKAAREPAFKKYVAELQVWPPSFVFVVQDLMYQTGHASVMSLSVSLPV